MPDINTTEHQNWNDSRVAFSNGEGCYDETRAYRSGKGKASLGKNPHLHLQHLHLWKIRSRTMELSTWHFTIKEPTLSYQLVTLSNTYHLEAPQSKTKEYPAPHFTDSHWLYHCARTIGARDLPMYMLLALQLGDQDRLEHHDPTYPLKITA